MNGTPIQDALRAADEKFHAGQFSEAEAICKDVLQQHPNHPHALNLLCIALRQQGNFPAAMEVAARAANAHPQIAEFHANYGEFARLMGRFDEAAKAFQRAIQIKPNEAGFHNSLGTVLTETRQNEAAIAEYERAIQLMPDNADAHSNLGGALRELGRLEEADAAIEQSMQIRPHHPKTYFNRAIVRTDQERFQEAVDDYRRAITFDPNFAMAHWSLGTLHLLLGETEAGWREYQWRPSAAKQFRQPAWKGEDLRGKTIILYSEQGLGDTIHFIRYVPLLIEKGATVWLGCQAELISLLSQTAAQILHIGQRMPEYDFNCSLLSLPMLFGASPTNIPAQIPYLTAREELIRAWSDRLGNKTRKLRVGIAWAGSKNHRGDLRRSLKFEQLASILKTADVEFVSLQWGEAASQAKGSTITDLTAELKDFSETAGLIANLDLVITVDTAVAHLAGAMGKPVWVFLPRIPDWRWLLEREDTPWYPTMRLLRQQQRGDWNEPIARAASQLAELVKSEPAKSE